jgi:L-alanine-DL-glutamate epimerase-like enolase superfamily enzyme
MQIMMEFHGFWNLPCAMKIAKALEPYDVAWLEGMLPQDNMAAYTTSARSVAQPLCISERLTRWGFREVLENTAASIIMPDLAWCGGLTETRKIATMAATYYLPIAPHNRTGPITHFASWHLATATPNLTHSRSRAPALHMSISGYRDGQRYAQRWTARDSAGAGARRRSQRRICPPDRE